jgi:hypothetical protein
MRHVWGGEGRAKIGGKPDGKRPLERPRRRREYNIMMGFGKMDMVMGTG